jgi:hypothetical protein
MSIPTAYEVLAAFVAGAADRLAPEGCEDPEEEEAA